LGKQRGRGRRRSHAHKRATRMAKAGGDDARGGAADSAACGLAHGAPGSVACAEQACAQRPHTPHPPPSAPGLSAPSPSSPPPPPSRLSGPRTASGIPHCATQITEDAESAASTPEQPPAAPRPADPASPRDRLVPPPRLAVHARRCSVRLSAAPGARCAHARVCAPVPRARQTPPSGARKCRTATQSC